MNFGKNHGLTFKEKVELLLLLETLPFWYRNHSFLSKIKKKHISDLIIPKNPIEKKFNFSTKNDGLSPQRIVYFLALFVNVKFPVKKSLFPIQNINKPSFLTWLYQKNQDKKKFQFSTKTMDYPLRKMSIFWHF